MRDLFVRFRRSNAFLATLAGAVTLAALAHFVAHWDPDWSLSNILLSLEASFATCMLLDVTMKMSAEDRARWDRIEVLLRDMAQDVDEIEKELSE